MTMLGTGQWPQCWISPLAAKMAKFFCSYIKKIIQYYALDHLKSRNFNTGCVRHDFCIVACYLFCPKDCLPLNTAYEKYHFEVLILT